MNTYIDKNGDVIKAGMTIKIGDDIEYVYACEDQYRNEDLGVNASNEEYLKNHPDAVRQYYSLSNFYFEDIEICK